MTKVAVLGSGKMGGAIARRLKKGGFEVSVWDRTRSKAEALAIGAVADSPADATRSADIIVSMVTGPQAIRDVYFGENGVFQASSNKIIVDMSTTGPGIAEELERGAAFNGAKLIEAPVVGSTPAVNSGSLFILAGVPRAEDLGAARRVLEQLGEVHYAGDPRSAAALKLIANSFLGIVSTAAAELIAAGTAHGVDPEEVLTILSRIWPGLRVREAGFVKHVHEPTMFAMRDLLKDLDLALAFYKSAAPSEVPLTSLTRELVAGVASEAPDLDISAIVNAYAPEATPVRQKQEVYR
ncbi:MAG: 3-hydroxyisobutyrate dehydrogenase [Chloroflexota bacterium]|jgi:3-hydroxyisobutyrate dehydrogenase|nr:3-hydroxyisobutyrate dehydrogenase [Chloroflexota bacterium]